MTPMVVKLLFSDALWGYRRGLTDATTLVTDYANYLRVVGEPEYETGMIDILAAALCETGLDLTTEELELIWDHLEMGSW